MKLDETNIEGLFKCDPVSQIDKGKKENIQSVKIGNNVICIRFLFSVKDRPSRKHCTTWFASYDLVKLTRALEFLWISRVKADKGRYIYIYRREETNACCKNYIIFDEL